MKRIALSSNLLTVSKRVNCQGTKSNHQFGANLSVASFHCYMAFFFFFFLFTLFHNLVHTSSLPYFSPTVIGL